MTETVKAYGAEISMEHHHDNSATIKIVRYMTSLSIPLGKTDVDNFLAAVAREFDVTITANPKPPKVGDVVDRDTAFGLPHGSLVEVAGSGVPYLLLTDGTVASRFHSTVYNRHAFDPAEQFTIVYIYTEGGNA